MYALSDWRGVCAGCRDEYNVSLLCSCMLHDTDYNDESSENTPPTVPVKIGGVGDKRAAKARTDARENKEVSDGSSLAALQRGTPRGACSNRWGAGRFRNPATTIGLRV